MQNKMLLLIKMKRCITIGPCPPKCIKNNTAVIPIGTRRCPRYYVRESPFPNCDYDCYDDCCYYDDYGCCDDWCYGDCCYCEEYCPPRRPYPRRLPCLPPPPPCAYSCLPPVFDRCQPGCVYY